MTSADLFSALVIVYWTTESLGNIMIVWMLEMSTTPLHVLWRFGVNRQHPICICSRYAIGTYGDVQCVIANNSFYRFIWNML